VFEDLWDPSSAEWLYLALGIVALGAAALPRLLQGRALSFPIIYLAGGVVLFSLPIGLPDPNPVEHVEVAERLTEVAVILSLFGVGLKIERPASLRGWGTTWRLLGITMLLTIGAVYLLGVGVLGLAAASAMLLGAVLAPTDPVLASDVQTEKPGEDEDQVRFSLTSEAGLNDGLAFPFTNAAIAMTATAGVAWVGEWVAIDVVYRIVVGVGVGWLCGWLTGRLAFEVGSGETRLAESGAGLIAVAGTFLTYGVTEIADGYGFLAVFVAARVLRAYERQHEFHVVLHNLAEQLERFLVAITLTLLGGAVATGILAPIGWVEALVVVLILAVVRPVAGLIGLIGDEHPPLDRIVIAVFGIRGVGSLYYLAHGFVLADFEDTERLWAIVVLTVVVSVVVHGITASPVMKRRDAAAARLEGTAAT
jgi:sodium/hydrogen antiporter